MIIDTDAHVVPGSLIETLRSERRSFPSVRLLADADTIRMAFAGEAPTRPIATRLSDLAQRREWLTSACLDHQVVGGWTDVYGYELPGEEGADWARCFKEHLTNDAAGLGRVDAARRRAVARWRARRAGARGGARQRLQGGDDRDQPKGVGGNLDVRPRPLLAPC